MLVLNRVACGCVLLLSACPIFSQQSLPGDSETLPRVQPPALDATAAELEGQGDNLRGQKDYLDAIDYYRAGIKKADSAVLHNKAGISYFQLFRDRDAKKEYARSLKLDRSYAEAHNNLGALYYREQRYGQAIKEYKKAIRLNDFNASFHSNLGTAYFSAKAFDDASHEYLRALALDPEIFDHKVSGGVSIRMISSNDLGHFHYVMAQMYGQHGDVERCRYYLAKANEEGYPIRDALHDGQFSTLRKDPKFLVFVRSLKPPSADE
jgi:tetratricopeptide (TPR) repeat protein